MTRIIRLKTVEGVGGITNLDVNSTECFSPDLNLVYASNAAGKSTLCSIFASLSEDDPNIILVDKAPHGTAFTGTPIISILGDAGDIELVNQSWSVQPKDVFVFDQNFVHKNVIMDGRGVTDSIRSNLVEVALGRRMVKLKQMRDAIQLKIQAHRKRQRELEAEIVTEIRVADPSLPINSEHIHDINEVEDVEDKITSKKRDLDATNVGEKIHAVELCELEIPKLPEKLGALLKVNIGDIAESAIAATKEHITKYAPRENGENWVTEGMSVATETGICPFCQQNLTDSELFTRHYPEFFSEAYTEHSNDFVGIEDDIREAMSDAIIERSVGMAEKNTDQVDFWNKHSEAKQELADPSQQLSELLQISHELVKEAVAAVSRKKSALTERLPENDPLYSIIAKFEGASALIVAHNRALLAANTAIKAAKGDIPSADEKNRIEYVYQALLISRALHQPQIKRKTNKARWFARKDQYLVDLRVHFQTLLEEEALKKGAEFCARVNMLLKELGFLRETAQEKTGYSLDAMKYQPG